MQPILLTGLVRGGTTWVGRMIGCHPDLEYLHEPFNPDLDTGRVYGLEPLHWWLHVHPENEGRYYAAVQRMIRLKPLLWSRLRDPTAWKRLPSSKSEKHRRLERSRT